MYQASTDAGRLRLRLKFPNTDYEDEYGACRAYLPEETSLEVAALERLEAGGPLEELIDPIRRRILVDLPRNYY